LIALQEYLPNDDERRGLIAYMQNSKLPKETLYADLSETEKYMYTMLDVSEAVAKFEAMLFRSVFKNRFDDINASIRTLNAACDELRSSEKFRKLMAVILTVVNQINTGGEGNMAIGFTLDALLKLNEAKAFDKKTSVLHYVVKLVKKNDEMLLTFSSDLGHIIPAENVLLDAVGTEVKTLSTDLVGVHKTVQVEAQRLEDAGELKPMTLEDLKEQRTSVRQVGSVAQFNKIDHLTGRTSMERFMVNAHYSCEQATMSIKDVKKKYIALLHYFGEDEEMPTGDFFGILRRFLSEFKKAVDQVEAIEKKAVRINMDKGAILILPSMLPTITHRDSQFFRFRLRKGSEQQPELRRLLKMKERRKPVDPSDLIL
jgi:Mg2+ and Co2+ transporter CorA